MKKLALILAALMLIGSIIGCAQQTTTGGDAATGNNQTAGGAETTGGGSEADDSDREIVIGISFGTLQEERWQRNLRNMEARAEALGNTRIIAQSADGDETRQITQCENMITQGVDVLMIIPVNGFASAPIIANAHAHDVPVVAYSRMIYDCDLDVYVSFDLRHVGVLQATFAVEQAPKGNYFLIGGAPTDTNVPLMRDGQMSVLQPYIDRGDINIVGDQYAVGWNPQEALIHTENGLSVWGDDVAAIITMNDATAGAAIQALTEHGLAGQVVVTGLDADISAAQRIMAGTQGMSVYRRFRVFDEMSIDLCRAVALRQDLSDFWEVEYRNNGYKDVPSIIERGELAMFTLHRENMFEALHDGWLEFDEVFRFLPENEWPEWAKNWEQ